jgi:hypothetical protein
MHGIACPGLVHTRAAAMSRKAVRKENLIYIYTCFVRRQDSYSGMGGARQVSEEGEAAALPGGGLDAELARAGGALRAGALAAAADALEAAAARTAAAPAAAEWAGAARARAAADQAAALLQVRRPKRRPRSLSSVQHAEPAFPFLATSRVRSRPGACARVRVTCS